MSGQNYNRFLHRIYNNNFIYVNLVTYRVNESRRQSLWLERRSLWCTNIQVAECRCNTVKFSPLITLCTVQYMRSSGFKIHGGAAFQSASIQWSDKTRERQFAGPLVCCSGALSEKCIYRRHDAPQLHH